MAFKFTLIVTFLLSSSQAQITEKAVSSKITFNLFIGIYHELRNPLFGMLHGMYTQLIH